MKSYMHNGVFKSLKQVVHFYNTRNLTTLPGEVINFNNPNPYARLRGKPLWAAPEFPSPVTLQNPSGALAARTPRSAILGLRTRRRTRLSRSSARSPTATILRAPQRRIGGVLRSRPVRVWRCRCRCRREKRLVLRCRGAAEILSLSG